MMVATSASTPAEMLLGHNLNNGWTVVEYINKRPNATGGRFSVGYKARNEEGKEALL